MTESAPLAEQYKDEQICTHHHTNKVLMNLQSGCHRLCARVADRIVRHVELGQRHARNDARQQRGNRVRVQQTRAERNRRECAALSRSW